MAEKNIFIKVMIRVLAIVGLILTIVPSILHFSEIISLQAVHTWMAVGMVVWFLTGSFWLGKKS